MAVLNLECRAGSSIKSDDSTGLGSSLVVGRLSASGPKPTQASFFKLIIRRYQGLCYSNSPNTDRYDHYKYKPSCQKSLNHFHFLSKTIAPCNLLTLNYY